MHFSTFPPKTGEWQALFSPKTLERGRILMGRDAVELLERNPTLLLGRVQGSEHQPYQVLLRSSGTYTCSCPSDVQPCKHVAALLFYAESHFEAGATTSENWLENLDPIQAKILLLELAQDPLVRGKLVQKAHTVHPGAWDALSAFLGVLERGDNIEYESELAEAAFEQLENLPSAEKRIQSAILIDLLENFEMEDEGYDPYDDNGAGYWEDLAGEWRSRAEGILGSALLEAGDVDGALEFLLPRVPGEPDLWPRALDVALKHPQGRQKLEAMLDSPQWDRGYRKGQNITLRRDLIRHFDGPTAYERELRAHLDTSSDYLELFNFLLEEGRKTEALDLASAGVRTFGSKGNQYSDNTVWMHVMPGDAVGQMLDTLRIERRSFEWERVAFRRTPSLELYHSFKNYPEFELAREELLRDPMLDGVLLELLLDDRDLPALERFIQKHPAPKFALKVKAHFPEACKVIFKQATLELIQQGNRTAYAQGARWAGEYLALEPGEVGQNWLRDLLEHNKRRSALLDEFKALRKLL